MDALKKIFPLSFKYKNSVADLIIGIIIQLVVGVLAGFVIALAVLLTGWIPVIGILIGIVVGLLGGLIDIYVLAGIVIEILAFAKVLKD